MIMIANLQYAWTLFVSPMNKATGWKPSDISFAFTLFILFQTWVQPAQGFLIDRLGPRLFTTLAGVLCGVGWGGLAFANSLPALYLLYVIAGIGAALVYGGCIGSALKWFTKERGLAAGLTAAGFGGGAALFVPIIASIIKSSGYRSAFLYTGIFQGCGHLDRGAVPSSPAVRARTRGARRPERQPSDGISSRPAKWFARRPSTSSISPS